MSLFFLCTHKVRGRSRRVAPTGIGTQTRYVRDVFLTVQFSKSTAGIIVFPYSISL